ncbi:MAG: hypothetical protein JRJ51_26175 [Deltaproteobacteria bacterium]|nr:hypothetical protein [Deltaproteobacteria bacterium]
MCLCFLVIAIPQEDRLNSDINICLSLYRLDGPYGTLQSKSIPGASILIFSYRGALLNYTNIRIRGLKSLAVVYPKGQKQLKKPKKIRTEKGYKPKVELWQGFLDAGSMTVALQSPMAVMKTKKSWILMIGYAPDASGAELEEDFLNILKSAK